MPYKINSNQGRAQSHHFQIADCVHFWRDFCTHNQISFCRNKVYKDDRRLGMPEAV
jgi:hypothetical protein